MESELMASQYDRGDLGEGIVLVFRRGNSEERGKEIRLCGLKAEGTYEVMFAGEARKLR